MLIAIILTAILTFVITALWSRHNQTRGMGTFFVFFTTLLSELDNLAKELGSEDIYSYWVKTKGKDYADNGMQNIKKTIDFLSFK